jgi:hypothetical protein
MLEDVKRIDVAQETCQWRAVVGPWVPQEAEDTDELSVSLSIRTDCSSEFVLSVMI